MSIERLKKKRDKLQRKANRYQIAANKLTDKITKRTAPVERVNPRGLWGGLLSPPRGMFGASPFYGFIPSSHDPLDDDTIEGGE